MHIPLIKIIGTMAFCLAGLLLQAQSFTITSDKESGTCGNQYVTFEAGFIKVATSFSFNSGTLPAAWASSPYQLGQACAGVFADRPDNSDYFWATINDSNGHRFVSTNEQDMRAGGQITFSLRFGRDDPSSGCENPDEPSEGVYLQYSTDGGVQWTTFEYWVPHQIGSLSPEGVDLYRWNEFTIAVPEEAKTSNTKFRWFQPSNSGSSYDNWGVDDISVFVLSEAQAYIWDIGDGQSYEEQTFKASFESGGLKTVKCTVVDANGQSHENSIAYDVVIDDEAPVAKAQNYYLILNKEGQASLIADYLDGGSSDNCSEIQFSIDKENFSCADLGDNTVTLTVTDNAGNASITSAMVSVYDFTAPQVLAQDMTVQLDEEGHASIDPEQINNGSADGCSDTLTFSLNKSHFTQDDLGENTVILTATDESGNQATARALVTVEDKLAPKDYAVTFEHPQINAETSSGISFAMAGAEVGAAYAYTIISENGGATIEGRGVVESPDQQFSNINLSSLPDGEVKLSLVLTDASGNTGETATAIALKDTSSPTVEIVSSVTDPVNQPFSAEIIFSEPVIGFSLENIELTNASATEPLTDDHQHFKVEIHPLADGLVTIHVATAVVMDKAGNPNQTASSLLSVTYDGTAPGAVLSASDTLVNIAFTVNIDFDEVVSGFTTEDIQVINGTVTDFQTENYQNFIALITPEQHGTVAMSIAADAAKDSAGNGNLPASESLTISYDVNPPAGYALHKKLKKVSRENVAAFSFQLEGMEAGTNLHYTISSAAGGPAVEGSQEVEQERLTVVDLDLSELADGELTLSFYLVDKAGNQGETITANTQKTTVEIVAVETLSSIEVPFATAFEKLNLPKEVGVTYSTGTRDQLGVVWNGNDFSATRAGVYTLEGRIRLSDCINTQNFKARIQVEVGDNLAPTQIHLSAATFSPAISPDQAIGTFSTQDADDRTHEYILSEGEGDTDNPLFAIVDNELFLKSDSGISEQTRFSIRVRSSDAYGNATEDIFTLSQTSYQPEPIQSEPVQPEPIRFVNTFSPNGDGINEVWIVPDLRFFNDVSIEVFDRSGRRVFHTTDPEQGWDGSVNGSIQNGGYYYIITINDIQLTKRGVLSVIK